MYRVTLPQWFLTAEDSEVLLLCLLIQQFSTIIDHATPICFWNSLGRNEDSWMIIINKNLRKVKHYTSFAWKP